MVIKLPLLCEKKGSLLFISVRARGVELSEKARVAAEHCRGGVEEKPEQNLSRPSTRMMLQMKKRS